VKKAAVDTAEADLQAAKASVRGLEAQAMSQRWQLQNAMEDVDNRVAQLHDRGHRISIRPSLPSETRRQP
jgi:membrane fusion protein (multidrug efflux system)